jgi:hypothetical protein
VEHLNEALAVDGQQKGRASGHGLLGVEAINSRAKRIGTDDQRNGFGGRRARILYEMPICAGL